jgi:hypothetical protein
MQKSRVRAGKEVHNLGQQLALLNTANISFEIDSQIRVAPVRMRKLWRIER